MSGTQTSKCIKCNCEHTYEIGIVYVCPECFHEWPKDGGSSQIEEDDSDVITDANGAILKDGDTVSVIKDLKVKGSSMVVKVGTKVKNIRLYQVAI